MNIENISGFSDGKDFRESNGYEKTLNWMQNHGLTLKSLIVGGTQIPDELAEVTPPAIINIARVFNMENFKNNMELLKHQPLNIAITGVSTKEGPFVLEDAFKLIGFQINKTSVFDLDPTILDEIKKVDSQTVACFHKDARETKLETNSQNIVFNDHMGNCCPPEINDDSIKETARVLNPNGLAIISITSSALLGRSKNRPLVPFNLTRQLLDKNTLELLNSSIFDLAQLKQKNPDLDVNKLKGSIIEISPDSFVVFDDNPEDPNGHGEWFKSINDHFSVWSKNNLAVVDINSKDGTDSHNPKLACRRHNVILKKNL